MQTALIETLGFAAATLTTLCWLPQAVQTIRTRDTRAISLWTQAMFASGIVLWLLYGLLIASWPLIGAFFCGEYLIRRTFFPHLPGHTPLQTMGSALAYPGEAMRKAFERR